MCIRDRGKSIALGVVITLIILALLIGLVLFVVYLQGGERRVPVQYAKKMVGRKMMGGQSSHIPIKVNTAGVIPVIFAASLLSIPSMVASFAGINTVSPTTTAGHIIKALSQSSWCNLDEPVYSIGLLLYIVLLIFFAYFYTCLLYTSFR